MRMTKTNWSFKDSFQIAPDKWAVIFFTPPLSTLLHGVTVKYDDL